MPILLKWKIEEQNKIKLYMPQNNSKMFIIIHEINNFYILRLILDDLCISKLKNGKVFEVNLFFIAKVCTLYYRLPESGRLYGI